MFQMYGIQGLPIPKLTVKPELAPRVVIFGMEIDFTYTFVKYFMIKRN
jgi:hypothetical protein